MFFCLVYLVVLYTKLLYRFRLIGIHLFYIIFSTRRVHISRKPINTEPEIANCKHQFTALALYSFDRGLQNNHLQAVGIIVKDSVNITMLCGISSFSSIMKSRFSILPCWPNAVLQHDVAQTSCVYQSSSFSASQCVSSNSSS